MIDRRPTGRAVLGGAVVASDAILLPWSDPAAQWGLGVFETIAVREAAPRHLEDHLRRLSAAALRFSATASKLLPQRVFSKNSQAPANTAAVNEMMKKLW